MPSCSPQVFDIGPGLLQVALQVVNIIVAALAVQRLQSVVQGQQASQSQKNRDEKGT